jgi:hypothetical protein
MAPHHEQQRTPAKNGDDHAGFDKIMAKSAYTQALYSDKHFQVFVIEE